MDAHATALALDEIRFKTALRAQVIRELGKQAKANGGARDGGQ